VANYNGSGLDLKLADAPVVYAFQLGLKPGCRCWMALPRQGEEDQPPQGP